MQVWEYEFRDVRPERGWTRRRLSLEMGRFQRSFAELGESGWELVSYQTVVVDGSMAHQAVFKRPTWVTADQDVLEAAAVPALAGAIGSQQVGAGVRGTSQIDLSYFEADVASSSSAHPSEIAVAPSPEWMPASRSRSWAPRVSLRSRSRNPWMD